MKICPYPNKYITKAEVTDCNKLANYDMKTIIPYFFIVQTPGIQEELVALQQMGITKSPVMTIQSDSYSIYQYTLGFAYILIRVRFRFSEPNLMRNH